MNVLDVILKEHNYGRDDTDCLIKPTRRLFPPKSQSFCKVNDEIDVVGVPPDPVIGYDAIKSMEVMEECEKFVGFARIEEKSDDWEESIKKSDWSKEQISLFRKTIEILHNDRLARLALRGRWCESAARRGYVDRSAAHFRQLMATSCQWDPRLSHWLHAILIEHLDTAYLAAYLDILQTLKLRIPTLVERLLAGSANRNMPVLEEGLSLLLKRPWDPAASTIHANKLGKLPNNPIIILIPSCLKKLQKSTPRYNLWSSHLSNLATLIPISCTSVNLLHKLTAIAYLEQMLTLARIKVADTRREHPNRPLIIVGWRTGAAVALQIAAGGGTAVTTSSTNSIPGSQPSNAGITAVVCLGLATRTAEGPRGDPDDVIYSVPCPVLFVTGENATSARPEDLEDIRVRMSNRTGLVVVGGADDCLRMRKGNRIRHGVTQSMVDRAILEEIGEFLACLLLRPPIPNVNSTNQGNTMKNPQQEQQKVDANGLATLSHCPRGPYKRRLSASSGSTADDSAAKRLKPDVPSSTNGFDDFLPKRGRKPGITKVNNYKPILNKHDQGINTTTAHSSPPLVNKDEALKGDKEKKHQVFRIQGGRMTTPATPTENKVEIGPMIAVSPNDLLPVRTSNTETPPNAGKINALGINKNPITVTRPVRALTNCFPNVNLSESLPNQTSVQPQLRPLLMGLTNRPAGIGRGTVVRGMRSLRPGYHGPSQAPTPSPIRMQLPRLPLTSISSSTNSSASVTSSTITNNNLILVSNSMNIGTKVTSQQSPTKLVTNPTVIKASTSNHITIAKRHSLPHQQKSPIVVSTANRQLNANNVNPMIVVKNKQLPADERHFESSEKQPMRDNLPGSSSALKGRPMYIKNQQERPMRIVNSQQRRILEVETPVVIPAIESTTRAFSAQMKDVSFGDDGDTMMLPLDEDIDVESVLPAVVTTNSKVIKAKQMIISSESGSEFVMQRDGKYVICKRNSGNDKIKGEK